MRRAQRIEQELPCLAAADHDAVGGEEAQEVRDREEAS
jgi:hypothetical protein